MNLSALSESIGQYLSNWLCGLGTMSQWLTITRIQSKVSQILQLSIRY